MGQTIDCIFTDYAKVFDNISYSPAVCDVGLWILILPFYSRYGFAEQSKNEREDSRCSKKPWEQNVHLVLCRGTGMVLGTGLQATECRDLFLRKCPFTR